MTPEDRLRAALRDTAGRAAPDPSGVEHVLTTATRRRRRRTAAASSLAVAALLLIAGVTVLGDDPTAEVRTVPATRTTTSRPAPPPTAVAVTAQGAVVVVDTATGRIVRTPAPVGSAAADQKPVRTPDGATVYFAKRGVDCGFDTLFEVPVDGRRAPRRLTSGLAAAFSPDGTKLAYVNTQGCVAANLVVRDVATGVERFWEPGPNSRHVFTTGGLDAVDWAPDNRRVAFQFDGGGVYVLDTLVPALLDVATPVQPRQQPRDATAAIPAWKPDDGRLAVAVRCCTNPAQVQATARTLLVDVLTNEATELLPPGEVVLSLDYDGSGQWLLWVDEDGNLEARGADGRTRHLGTGFATATW